tara:strand:- start:91097 stop:91498 length:402 start_codon:yes stop_codon:yes gene_type:complete
MANPLGYLDLKVYTPDQPDFSAPFISSRGLFGCRTVYVHEERSDRVIWFGSSSGGDDFCTKELASGERRKVSIGMHSGFSCIPLDPAQTAFLREHVRSILEANIVKDEFQLAVIFFFILTIIACFMAGSSKQC